MDIKFISYTGKYPNLCAGVLTLEIDGKLITFGNSYTLQGDYARFWYSGGHIYCTPDGDYGSCCDAWKLDSAVLPDFLKPYGQQLIQIFNDNVFWGCCGGCI